MAGMDLVGASPGADIRRSNNRLLLKMALEHKDYRQARREVAAEDAAQSVGTTPFNQGATLEIDRTELHGVALQIQVQNGRARVDILQVDIQTVHATLQRGQNKPKPKDPLVLDLSGEGPTTTGREGAQPFDLQGNGAVAPTSFVSGGSAFLALDRNGNGQIDSGLELFGDQHGASDGFAELAKFDRNGDGRIDAEDPVYDQLQLVFGDGHREGLAQSGVARIQLTNGSGYALSNGDEVLRQGMAYGEQGQTYSTYAMGLQQFEALA